jgi:hypothetical protein
MSWALRFDGVNDYVSIPAEVDILTRPEWRIEFTLAIEPMSNFSSVVILGRDGNDQSSIRLSALGNNNSMAFEVRYTTSSSSATLTMNNRSIVTDGQPHDYVITRNSSGVHSFFVDGALEGTDTTTISSSLSSNAIGRRSGLYSQEFTLYGLIGYNSDTPTTELFNYDPSLSGGTGSVLTDSVAANNGNLTNFPTDNSQWVSIGSSTIDATVSATIPEPQFTVQASKTTPAISSNVDFDVTSPQFSVQASKTAPGNNATADFQITAPTFTVSADSSVPQFNTNVSFEINAPQFSIAATNTQPSEGASVSIVVPAPQFSVQASRTIPDITANIDTSISAPIFTIYAGTDSDVFYYAKGSVAYLSTNNNIANLPSESRIATINKTNNIVSI